MKPTLLVIMLGLSACTGGGEQASTAERDSLTRRQRDSTLAESRLPGARGVGKALEASDAAADRAAALDSIR